MFTHKNKILIKEIKNGLNIKYFYILLALIDLESDKYIFNK